MSKEEKNIDEIFERLDRKEKKFRYRTFFYIGFLSLLGGAWLLYTSTEVKNMRSKTKQLESKSVVLANKVETLNDSLEYKQAQVNNIEEALHIGENFKNKTVDINEVDTKMLSFGLGRVSEVFRKIKQYQYREVQFSLNGTSPSRGFNSVTMMSNVLKQSDLLKNHTRTTRGLMSELALVKNPKSGDIIVYEAGYCMLYIKENKEFVIGMTPFGILEIKPDFAKKVAILRPQY